MAQTSSVRIDIDDCIRGIAQYQDKDRFRLLFNYLAPRLKSFHRRSGASDGLAEDLTQETLLTVWRKAMLYDPARANPTAWIYTISRNLLIDVVRHEKHPQAHDMEAEQQAPATPEEQLSAKQWETRLESVIRLLPDEEACLLRLNFFSGLSHAALATALQMPLGTVKSRLRSAIARMRLELIEAP